MLQTLLFSAQSKSATLTKPLNSLPTFSHSSVNSVQSGHLLGVSIKHLYKFTSLKYHFFNISILTNLRSSERRLFCHIQSLPRSFPSWFSEPTVFLILQASSSTMYQGKWGKRRRIAWRVQVERLCVSWQFDMKLDSGKVCLVIYIWRKNTKTLTSFESSKTFRNFEYFHIFVRKLQKIKILKSYFTTGALINRAFESFLVFFIGFIQSFTKCPCKLLLM